MIRTWPSVICLLVSSPAIVTGLQAGEARGPKSKDEGWELLRSEREYLEEYFGGYSGPPRTVTVRAGNRQIVMVYHGGPGRKPLLFSFEDRKLVWKKSPLDQVRPFNYLPSLASSDDGSVLFSWYGTDPRGVHAMSFDREGDLLWKTQISADDPMATSITALGWRGLGWIICYTGVREGRIHLLNSKGDRVWGPDGKLVFQQRGYHNPISAIQDSKSSVFLLWYEYPRDRGFRKTDFVAQRFDRTGTTLWPRPLRIGEAPSFALVMPRQIDLILQAEGRVLAKLYKGMAGDMIYDVKEYEAVISADGKVRIGANLTTATNDSAPGR